MEFLSGGEKARLALAKFMVTPASLLLLDEVRRASVPSSLRSAAAALLRILRRAPVLFGRASSWDRCHPGGDSVLTPHRHVPRLPNPGQPTNHLDIPSKEMLEEALVSFPGTVLAVSHDRYFLRRISTRVLELGGGKVADYEGDYETYLNRNEDAAEKQAERDEQKRELEKSQIKAKSKMSKAEKARGCWRPAALRGWRLCSWMLSAPALVLYTVCGHRKPLIVVKELLAYSSLARQMAEKKEKARAFQATAPTKTKGTPVAKAATAAAKAGGAQQTRTKSPNRR